MPFPAKIMIVDDDPVLRMVAGEMLRQSGYEVSEAEDGEVAIRKLELAPVDLVIVDMLMPNKEGIETIREIKTKWPKTRLAAITGGGRGLQSDYLLRVAKTFGADSVHQKPPRATGFIEIVDEALGRSGETRAAS